MKTALGAALASLALHGALLGLGGLRAWPEPPKAPVAPLRLAIQVHRAEGAPAAAVPAAVPPVAATRAAATVHRERAPARPRRAPAAAPAQPVPSAGVASPGDSVAIAPVAAGEAESSGAVTAAADLATAAAAPLGPGAAEPSAVPMPPVLTTPPPAPSPPSAAPDVEPWPAGLTLPMASHARRFRVYWGDFTDGVSVARLEYRFERDGDHYALHTAARAEGLMAVVYSGVLTQTSVGHIGDAGLVPLQYVEQRGKRPQRSVTFDREAGLLRPVGQPPVPLPAGTQDRLSVFYQLAAWVRADPGRFTAGQVRALPVASLRRVQTERFEVVGDVMLATPAGLLRALRLRRPPPPGSDDPEIQVWLGYDFAMLPIRLRAQDAHGRVLDQILDARRSGESSPE